MLVEISLGIIKINGIGLAAVSAEKANFNIFNIGHHGSSFKLLEYLMKFPIEASQIESGPEVVPYPPWVIYENQFFTLLLCTN